MNVKFSEFASIRPEQSEISDEPPPQIKLMLGIIV